MLNKLVNHFLLSSHIYIYIYISFTSLLEGISYFGYKYFFEHEKMITQMYQIYASSLFLIISKLHIKGNRDVKIIYSIHVIIN